MNRLKLLILSLLAVLTATAADPTATRYDARQCEGSSMPYPTVKRTPVPDSLEAVMINHVGRHGARFPSSSRFTKSLERMLLKADSLHTITPQGRQLLALCREVTAKVNGRWGALDSLGMAEQRAIASRMVMTFPDVIHNSRINAVSSYVPRCVMSMDEFTHQITRLDNHVEIYTSSGRQNSELVRPFDTDQAYRQFMADNEWHKVYDEFTDKAVGDAPARRVLGKDFPMDASEARDFALNEYKLISGCAAMSVNAGWDRFLTLEEYNALWSVENMHHYLTHSASTLSQAAPEMASHLLLNIIKTTDAFIDGSGRYAVELRFGHAETLMPLLALMHVPGCYYMTNYFDTVGLHWRDFYVVPMASNLQLILLRDKKGEYFVRLDLNEVPVPVIPGRNDIYVPWKAARAYFNRCLPLIDQL